MTTQELAKLVHNKSASELVSEYQYLYYNNHKNVIKDCVQDEFVINIKSKDWETLEIKIIKDIKDVK